MLAPFWCFLEQRYHYVTKNILSVIPLHRCDHLSHLFILSSISNIKWPIIFISYYMYASWMCKWSPRCTWSASSRRSLAHPRGAIQPIAARRIRKTGPRWEWQKRCAIQQMKQDTFSKKDPREPDTGKVTYRTLSCSTWQDQSKFTVVKCFFM